MTRLLSVASILLLVRQEATTTLPHHHVTLEHVVSLSLYLTDMKLILSGDIHPNPGPSSNSDSSSISTDSYTDLLNSGVSVMHLNIQSLKPKLDILQVEAQPYDILIFTETWLTRSTTDEDLHISNFNLPFRYDRPDRPGGGVAIYVREGFHATRRHDLSVAGVESVWIDLKLNKRTFIIGGIYRPPDSNK